jgi:hypothetical protein
MLLRKFGLSFTKINGVISQTVSLVIVTAMRTSDVNINIFKFTGNLEKFIF